MSAKLLRGFWLTLLTIFALAACGGGDTQTAGGGIGGSGISFGTVQQFGSVVVNNTHFDDSNASVTLNGEPGDNSLHHGLKLGMVVKVTGSFSGNSGVASSIEFRNNVEGPVCSNQADTTGTIRTLSVLGQTVIVDATTNIDNGSIPDVAALGANDVVEISGLPDATGVIHASFIERKDPAPSQFEVKGLVSQAGMTTFSINSLVVDFSGIAIMPPANGQFVEVKGTASCNGNAPVLMASSVEVEAEGAGNIGNGNRAEVEGIVTQAFVADGNGGGTFRIGNQAVRATAATAVLPVGDFTLNDLKVGVKVEAEGTLVNGELVAAKVSFRENVKLESNVQVGDNDSFTLVGLPGITIVTNSATDNRTSIAPDVHVRVQGMEGPNNTVLATRVDAPTGTTVLLQGTVDAVAEPNITILGVTANTSSISEFSDIQESPISRAAFFGQVQIGTLVKIKGDLLVGATVDWKEAELED